MKLWLYLPPLWSHYLGQWLLKWRGFFFRKKKIRWSPFSWKNLYFDNPLGIAGGLDKSAENINGWWTYGPGFLEIGTITPEKQTANKGEILKRDIQNQALWNFMGFPNRGVDFVLEQLEKIKKPYFTPIFINIGKGRSTPIEKAVEDYQFLIKKLHAFASAFVLNISSPNTKELRKLFETHLFESFLDSVFSEIKPLKKSIPILLKINPDLSDNDFLRVISVSEKKGVEGWVICNSTIEKGCLAFPSHGGVSGRPLAERSIHLLKLLIQFLGQRRKNKLIVSLGGVMTSEDVLKRLSLGADLVQVYATLTFSGPSFFKETEKIFKFQKSS